MISNILPAKAVCCALVRRGPFARLRSYGRFGLSGGGSASKNGVTSSGIVGIVTCV